METKICTKCGLEKPIEQFQKDKQKKSGRRPDCGSCNSKQCVERAKTRREQINLNNLKFTTGILPEQYKSLLKEQNGVCAICGKPNVRASRNLSIDHCHKTKFVRGLLCTKCNFGLGYFDDNEQLLLKAISYLSNNISNRKIIHKGYQYERRKKST